MRLERTFVLGSVYRGRLDIRRCSNAMTVGSELPSIPSNSNCVRVHRKSIIVLKQVEQQYAGRTRLR